MVPLCLVPALVLLFFYISTFRSMCAVPNMAVFCSSLTSWFPGISLTYFLNDLEILLLLFRLLRIELQFLSLSSPSLVAIPTEEVPFLMYKSIKKVQITSPGFQALADSWGDGNAKTGVASSLFHETSFRIATVLYRAPSTGTTHVTRCDSSVSFICRNYLFKPFRQHQYYKALRWLA